MRRNTLLSTSATRPSPSDSTLTPFGPTNFAPFSRDKYRPSALISHRQSISNGVFTRSSKRPANFPQMYSKYTC